LGIENFKFAIVTEEGVLRSSIGNVTGAAEQTEKEKFCQEWAILVDCTTAMALGASGKEARGIPAPEVFGD
jgi:hypothetical protein